MDVATQAKWDEWIKNHIALALQEHRKTMTKSVAKRLEVETAKSREEIAGLRADMTIQTDIARGQIAEIKKGSRDVA